MTIIEIGKHKNLAKHFRKLRKRGFFYIAGEYPSLTDIPVHEVFDITLHRFNPLKDITEKRARQLADVLYNITPGGANTLTVRNGRIALQQALLQSTRLDKLKTDSEEVELIMQDVLFNPIVRKVLCSDEHNEFSFNPQSVVLARINKRELGRTDALILSFFLVAQQEDQVVIDDLGFIGRNAHASLIDEDRLVAGLHSFDQIKEQKLLYSAVELIDDKKGYRAKYKDAEILAHHAGKLPGTDGFSTYVHAAMQ